MYQAHNRINDSSEKEKKCFFIHSYVNINSNTDKKDTPTVKKTFMFGYTLVIQMKFLK
jgi:hypothetical protein